MVLGHVGYINVDVGLGLLIVVAYGSLIDGVPCEVVEVVIDCLDPSLWFFLLVIWVLSFESLSELLLSRLVLMVFPVVSVRTVALCTVSES